MRISRERCRRRLAIREKRRLELKDEALCMALSKNGRFLAVGLLDSTASIHFQDSLKFFLSLYGHSQPVTTIDISHVCFGFTVTRVCSG